MSEKFEDPWASEDAAGNADNSGVSKDARPSGISDTWETDPGWSPDKVDVQDEVEELADLVFPIRSLWQAAIFTSAASLGLLIWSLGNPSTLIFQGVLGLDAVMVLILGFGGSLRQPVVARMLTIWVGIFTIVIASFSDPLTFVSRFSWVAFRAVMLMPMLWGANAVARYHALRSSKTRKDVMKFREAIDNLRGPVALIAAASLIMFYSSQEFARALEEPGGEVVVKDKEGAGGKGARVNHEAEEAKPDDPAEIARKEKAEREAAQQREYDAMVAQAELDGRAAGENGDGASCLSEGIRRDRACDRGNCRSANLIFLESCLSAAKETVGVCGSVPASGDAAGTQRWKKEACKGWVVPVRTGSDPDPDAPMGDPRLVPQAASCEAYFSRVQAHCSGLAGAVGG
ncbi:MAG: hypothetical protein ACI91F_002137 [Candidatus Binatia bacterium]|jgi:hypothetical protein